MVKVTPTRDSTARPVVRISLRRILSVLSVLAMASTFLFLFTVRTLHRVDRKHHQPVGLSKPPLPKQPPLPNERPETNGDVQSILLRTIGRTSLPLTAFVESPVLPSEDKPLPIRNNTSLQKYIYPRIQTCRDIPNLWPVDHPIDWDTTFGPNVGSLKPLYPLRHDYADKVCPVDADPYLPWIHDVFVRWDGSAVEFVAHNKRRCRTAPSFAEDLQNLEPQVALLQSVPVHRVVQVNGKWTRNESASIDTHHPHRYRLSSIEDADPDGRETRFICQFHTLKTHGAEVERVVLGETLSVYPYNYEHANFRKGPKPHPLLTRPQDDSDVHGAHNEQIWNSVLHFSCPIPPSVQYESHLTGPTASGSATIKGDIPSIYLDLVPIRTRPRETREGYCPQVASTFDPRIEWGTEHILPTVEDSGRWANIPLCPLPMRMEKTKRKESHQTSDKSLAKQVQEATKPHYLIGCLWASAAFTTRGAGATLDASTSLRLLEWLTYHLYVANLDHVYVYDNTEANTNETSLKPILDLFPSDRVTHIPWKHRVCNNNRPAHQNAGERSSQYTAEASCRIRYGPTTEWLVSFDTDEYLIPQGNWSDLQEWLRTGVASGAIDPKTHILSFFQARAVPNVEYMEPFVDPTGRSCRSPEAQCLSKLPDVSFLRAYDCEPTPLPKPGDRWRAKKQIYRPSFVLNHFVHYSTVTQRIHDAPEEQSPPFIQRKPWERRVNELTEAFMLHTKTTAPPATEGWKRHCQDAEQRNKCPVGIRWPETEDGSYSLTNDGFAFNCYSHERIHHHLAHRLDALMTPLLKAYNELLAT